MNAAAPIIDPIAARRLLLLRRLLAADMARDRLLDYTRFTMPDPTDMDNPALSIYDAMRFHEVMAEAVEKLESGKTKRLIITCPPRHGKTELATRHFMGWYMGKHPEQHLMFGTYNDIYADENGRAVREIVTSPQHAQVFPGFGLKTGSASSKRLETLEGGVITFAGRGSTFTGRGGHGLILDDPIKNDEEADSKLIRDKLWSWFNKTVTTRMMTKDAFILIIQTRWHEDDIVGRLLDPSNPWYDEAEGKNWQVIEMPALAGEHDLLGRPQGEALWPSRFDVAFLLEQQRRDPRAFQSLYQGRPTPESGSFFTKDMIRTYQPGDLPKNLRFYSASDHAVSEDQNRDRTCLMTVGVDQFENVYVMDDLFWRRSLTDQVVDEMIRLMAKFKPIYWWAERGHISKSIGPFLRKRMMEERTFVSVVQMAPINDKQQRAQSIQGRMSMGKVFFPAHARWWPEAREQLVRFPHGANDDFVDALAYIGLGINLQGGPRLTPPPKALTPGTFGYIIKQARVSELKARTKADTQDW